jgi:hypothetical protein
MRSTLSSMGEHGFIVHQVSEEEHLAKVAAWEAAHPGYTKENFVDAFRDETGELIESEEFFDAVFLFAITT